jgi:hypothetical protein
MNTATSLGPLAYAVIEQYGDLARKAVALSVGRRQAACLADGVAYRTCSIIGHLFSEDELALQYLQAGNWIAVGCISDGTRQMAIEINLTTQAVRERPEPCLVESGRVPDLPEVASVARVIVAEDDGAPWSTAPRPIGCSHEIGADSQ